MARSSARLWVITAAAVRASSGTPASGSSGEVRTTRSACGNRSGRALTAWLPVTVTSQPSAFAKTTSAWASAPVPKTTSEGGGGTTSTSTGTPATVVVHTPSRGPDAITCSATVRSAVTSRHGAEGDTTPSGNTRQCAPSGPPAGGSSRPGTTPRGPLA